jgi:short-subunit dehydrogenase
MHSSQFLENKIALITGASSGIGESTAREFARHGIEVILVARREEKLKQITEEIIQEGGNATFFTADLTNAQERITLWHNLQAENKIPHILVNNAGLGWYGYFNTMPWPVGLNLLQLNIEASVHLASLALPTMLANNYGHIINIGSIAGKLPEQGIALYSSSKAFIDSFTTVLYRELVGTNVHVSVIRSGAVKTEFFDTARKIENGGSIPNETMAISVSRVSRKIYRLLRSPRKVVYVPGWTWFSPLLETCFGWLLDWIGPVLLKRSKR